MRRPLDNSIRSRVSIASPAGADTRRIDQLAQTVDYCAEAKRIAEAVGETFLAYLLAMAIQETRSAMRAEVDLKTRAP